MKIYFDTETTGIPARSLPWQHDSQPYIVSLAWAIVNEEGSILNTQHHLIQPQGWVIDEAGKAFAAHKIPHSRCLIEGRPIEEILTCFIHDLEWHLVKEILAYNIQFDIDLVTIACERLHKPWPNWPTRIDVMPLARAYCQIPPTEAMLASPRFRNEFKYPKLSEAVKIILGEDFPEAHDALADVKATIAIHKKLEEISAKESTS